MPAMLDDPSSPTVYRVSGAAPFPDPHDLQLPNGVTPRQVTLRDRVTTATIVPFSSHHQVPPSLLAYLSDQFRKEIEGGDTYPMLESMPAEKFASYWFQNFAAVMLLGSIESLDDVVEGENWAVECLGSFYIKPNYPGRSSHVCNAGFLVTDAARNRGVGRLLGETYIDWAPKLGYSYSVFNLVYETNIASCRIWDALGFKRIGRVKGAGNLKSYPGQFIDAIIYGRDLGSEGEEVSEERFDKIKYYLKFGKYPVGADRAEKSRLRSAATHYKLIPESDTLMLKDKEVISNPQRQYEIAKQVHTLHHGGINKTTATIAETYHWVGIKAVVSHVIKNCSQCKELGKSAAVRADGVIRMVTNDQAGSRTSEEGESATGTILSLHPEHIPHDGQGSVSPQVLHRNLSGHDISSSHMQSQIHLQPQTQSRPSEHSYAREDHPPLDPRVMKSAHGRLDDYSPRSQIPPDSHHNHHSPQQYHNHVYHPTGYDDDLNMLIHEDDGIEDDEEGEDSGGNNSPMRDADDIGAVDQPQTETTGKFARSSSNFTARGHRSY